MGGWTGLEMYFALGAHF